MLGQPVELPRFTDEHLRELLWRRFVDPSTPAFGITEHVIDHGINSSTEKQMNALAKYVLGPWFDARCHSCESEVAMSELSHWWANGHLCGWYDHARFNGT